ncbi:class I SAM-dependent methyltransferase [Ascidiimonas sp. W6]|uniref:class I SAM-dependent methyltransferase n=1 Tax=Ascidiimonas meishanensis TaxID=3128903 RepID=UPI0030EBEEDD
MSKEKILAAYETMAVSYNNLIDQKPHNAYYDRPTTLKLLGDVKGKKILDAACGPGKYAEILLAKGATVTGFDLSPSMIALAKERNKNQANFFVHDLSAPFTRCEDAAFDVVLCALALHYVADWNPVIKEFQRVLKPGGSLVISIEHPFFEYNYFKSKKYFEVEAVSTTWRGFGKAIKMHSYRRPLEKCIRPLTENGFYLDELIEPKPVEEFKQLDPIHYKELNKFPAFMHVRGIKK